MHDFGVIFIYSSCPNVILITDQWAMASGVSYYLEFLCIPYNIIVTAPYSILLSVIHHYASHDGVYLVIIDMMCVFLCLLYTLC